MKTQEEIKIKTPYGVKNWSFVKMCFDSHDSLVGALNELVNRFELDGFESGRIILCVCNQYLDTEDCRHLRAKKALKLATSK